MDSFRPLLTHIGLLALVVCSLFVLVQFTRNTTPTISIPVATTTEQTAAAAGISATTTPEVAATSTKIVATSTPAVAVVKKASAGGTKSASTSEAARVRNPYSTPPLSFDDINTSARQALVNILCMNGAGSLRPISGSGVIIDPRGVILTNAHVAQYVLLAQSGKVNLSCTVRTGSPAVARWIPHVLYIPPVWLREHVTEITTTHVLGTGEHDYALLVISSTVDGSPLPGSFHSIPPDTREAIGFVGDQVLAASYPAEFLGGYATQSSLYTSSSIAAIKQLMTFGTKNVDVISVGGTIQAQAGSSGGAVINAWGKLVGIITTTSEGATTGERDLRAVTLSYIDRDLSAQKGLDLQLILGGDPAAQAADFVTREAPGLIELLLKQIFRQ